MEKIKNVLYGFFALLLLTLTVLLLVYINLKPIQEKDTTETVSIEITKVEKQL